MHVLLAVLLLLAAFPATADDPAGPGLDLLLLVDRSGSMSSHSPASIVDALPLALNVTARSSRSARVSHRFGIVSFGTQAQTDVPLTVVDTQTLPLLRNRIGALRSQSLGHTNLAAAFEAAAAAFGALPLDARRRRAILLLTDGHSDVPGAPEKIASRDVDRAIEKLARPISIDVLLFGARETLSWTGIARERIHQVRSERGDLLATLHRVVSELAGVRSTQHELAGASETLVLPPYLDLVVFDIFRGTSAQNVSVLAPGSWEPLTSKTPGVEEVHTGDSMSIIAVRRPAAGAWVFRKSDPAVRVRVLSQQFFPRGTLVRPAAMPGVQQHEHVSIGYRLDDGTGRALQELLGYPLSVDVAVAMPDGQRVVLPMTREASSASLYAARETECRVAGRYWTEVLVTTADGSGQLVRIFEDHWSGFTVHEAAPRRALSVAMHGVAPDQPRWRFASMQPLMIAIVAVPVLALLFFVMRRR
jgi:hypothetical protein